MHLHQYKQKFFDNGYNAINCRIIGGRKTIVIMLYLPKYETKPVATITSVDNHLDPFNAMLLTLQYGTKVDELVMNGFFPDWESDIKHVKKNFPGHF